MSAPEARKESMTVDGIRVHRRKLEERLLGYIGEQCADFERLTGIQVCGLSVAISRTCEMGARYALHDVTVELERI